MSGTHCLYFGRETRCGGPFFGWQLQNLGDLPPGTLRQQCAFQAEWDFELEKIFCVWAGFLLLFSNNQTVPLHPNYTGQRSLMVQNSPRIHGTTNWVMVARKLWMGEMTSAQVYTRQNHRLEDGKLIITARKEGGGYTSTRITTKDKVEFRMEGWRHGPSYLPEKGYGPRSGCWVPISGKLAGPGAGKSISSNMWARIPGWYTPPSIPRTAMAIRLIHGKPLLQILRMGSTFSLWNGNRSRYVFFEMGMPGLFLFPEDAPGSLAF